MPLLAWLSSCIGQGDKVDRHMKKWFACSLLILLPSGCAETSHAEHGQELTLYEIRKDHPYQWVEKHHAQLTDQQIGELSQHGIELSKDEKTVVYYSMTTRRGRSVEQ